MHLKSCVVRLPRPPVFRVPLQQLRQLSGHARPRVVPLRCFLRQSKGIESSDNLYNYRTIMITSAWLASTIMLSNAMPCSARPTASSRCSLSVAWSRCTAMGTDAECALPQYKIIFVWNNQAGPTRPSKTEGKDPSHKPKLLGRAGE